MLDHLLDSKFDRQSSLHKTLSVPRGFFNISAFCFKNTGMPPLMWSVLLLLQFVTMSRAQVCEWPDDYADLRPRCACGSGGNLRLTVQCNSVELHRLVEALKTMPPLDHLAVLNASVPTLGEDAFSGLDVQGLQLSSVGLGSVSALTFRGVERTLVRLSLDQNELRKVPAEALNRLGNLKELDLSRNRITEVQEGAFEGLPLMTLVLADNNLDLSEGAFKGLESTLHNLNLRGTGQTRIPSPIKRLEELSYLDLSQNSLKQLPANGFSDLGQLATLSIERSGVESVDPMAFEGLNGTLRTLKLLNNKIEEFPTAAVRTLTQLTSLDIGFNRIKVVPDDAFIGNPVLTLLAMEGNPLTTLSKTSFSHLNSTLRGLSIGGSTLVCDCKLRWIVEWVKSFNLDVTSRERNPQFCGRPTAYRRRILPQMSPSELKCDDEATKSSTPVPTTVPSSAHRSTAGSTGRDLRAPRTSSLDQLHLTEVLRRGSELTVKWEGYREDNIVRARSAAPVHAMYRVFGEPHFQVGLTTNPTSGWAQFQVPEGKAVVVCVVDTAQAATLSPTSVPRNQCNEVNVERVSETQLSKIIIASSAAVCGMIVVAVIVFVCCSRRSGKSRQNHHPHIPRPAMKSEHEWETSSLYSARSIPRARAYHGSVNPSYLPPDDVQSFRSLPPARARMAGSRADIHSSQIALSQLSGHHSFLGTGYGGGDTHHNGWGGSHHWDNVDAYSERHAPSRLSYAKDNFG